MRQVCSAALALRSATKLRVRLPLAKLRVAAADAERLRDFVDLIRGEVNVKEVELTTDLASHGSFEVTVNTAVTPSSRRKGWRGTSSESRSRRGATRGWTGRTGFA